jgi:hypothetical protein
MTATAEPATPAQVISLEIPASNASVGNPLRIQGRTTLMPFEGNLVVRVYDAWGQLAAQTPIVAQGNYGGPATFEAEITYGGVPGAGKIEVVETSPKDGSVEAQTSVNITLQGLQGSGYVEMPGPLEQVTLPVRLLARVGQSGQQINITVTWEDGTQFARVLTTLPGRDGRGVAISALDWVSDPRPTQPATQNGHIQIHNLDGQLLVWQPIEILHPDDPGTIGTNVYWVINEEVVAEPIRIPRTLGIGRASLNALLWGPVPGNLSAYTTALPHPVDIIDYPGRTADWKEYIRVQDLTIIDGVARVDVSGEILAHMGGATGVLLIREQIAQTLLQFSTVNEVIITVAGQPDMLEP